MYYYGQKRPFAEIVGMTISRIDVGDDEIRFVVDDGREYVMYHQQDCCEGVSVDDVVGDVADLIGSPVLRAEERSQSGGNADGTETWTFYEIATIKGSVTIKWYGSSSGYYSESVDFRIDKEASA